MFRVEKGGEKMSEDFEKHKNKRIREMRERFLTSKKRQKEREPL